MLHHVDHYLRPFARMALIALIAVSGVFFVCASSAAASDPVPVDEEHFPDDVFRAYVAQNIDTSGDTLLSDAEREAVTVINVKKSLGASDKIATLQGIGYFPKLQELDCMYNKLTELDLSGNVKITKLICDGNPITSLDLSALPQLQYLSCGDSELRELDVSQNAELKELYCGCYSDLTSLDLRHNLKLQKLDVETLKLGSLDVRKNTELTYLCCYDCSLERLDLAGNSKLTRLNCNHNKIQELDLSGCTELRELYCQENDLHGLDVSNCLKLRALECYFNKMYTLTLGNITTLNSLHCWENKLSTLDVSKNTGLVDLNCSNNILLSLTIGKNSALRHLICSENRSLSELDVLQCRNLTSLKCRATALTELAVYGLDKLTTLECDDDVNVIRTPAGETDPTDPTNGDGTGSDDPTDPTNGGGNANGSDPTDPSNGGSNGTGNSNGSDPTGNANGTGNSNGTDPFSGGATRPGSTNPGSGNTSGAGASAQSTGTKKPVGKAVKGAFVKKNQKIICATSLRRNCGGPAFALGAKAKTRLTYRSMDTSIAQVSAKGLVTLKRPGTVRITVRAAQTTAYKPASATVTITAGLAKPKLKAKNKKTTKVKLTWSKVACADGYKLYVKSPGDKKYKCRLTKSARVKSVTHLGLTKGKTYCYKIRAFSKVGGRTIYSPYSKVRKVRIRK